MLSKINYHFITAINKILGISTPIRWSMEFGVSGKKTERLVNLCKKVDATEYLSGPSAKDYIDESLFSKEGITVSWMHYDYYPEYNQLYPPFDHQVSILDLLFNKGKKAKNYMKSFNHS